MTESEWQFLQDKRVDRKMICDDYVDRKLLNTSNWDLELCDHSCMRPWTS